LFQKKSLQMFFCLYVKTSCDYDSDVSDIVVILSFNWQVAQFNIGCEVSHYLEGSHDTLQISIKSTYLIRVKYRTFM